MSPDVESSNLYISKMGAVPAESYLNLVSQCSNVVYKVTKKFCIDIGFIWNQFGSFFCSMLNPMPKETNLFKIKQL